MTTNTTTISQIGRMNVLAISGGRVKAIDEHTIELPVRAGYHVRVAYIPGSDTYTVSRIFRRAGKEWVKGQVDHVYCDELGEVSYQASCYVNVDFGVPA